MTRADRIILWFLESKIGLSIFGMAAVFLVMSPMYLFGIGWVFGLCAAFAGFIVGWTAAYRYWRKRGYLPRI